MPRKERETLAGHCLPGKETTMNRRRDPRTNAHYSLRNLLRHRSPAAVAVLGTSAGILMAGSQEDRVAQRVAAHAADALFSKDGARVIACNGKRTGGRLSGLRFQADGCDLFLAVLDPRASCDRNGFLQELADRVRCILGESRRDAAVMAA